jgi:pyruvate,orthophosphate dikinase
MFGNVVMGLDHHLFEHQLVQLKASKGVQEDTELSAADLQVGLLYLGG